MEQPPRPPRSTWKYGYPIIHPPTRESWRTWLAQHHGTARGAWVASWRRGTGLPVVRYPELVEEALCFGWIDSMADTLDERRRLQLFTPRKPRSTWTRLNRERVARLEAQGRMTDAGLHAVEVAKTNGWWTIYDRVEDLREPQELAAALDAAPRARREWDSFPPSARKLMLWWVISAAKPETRARRISAIIEAAEQGRRAQG